MTGPIAEQYQAVKRAHPNALLLFRVGDFFKTFDDDANDLARICGLSCTRTRTQNRRIAGFSHHHLAKYLRMLVEAGRQTAVHEGVEDSSGVKGLVTVIVTPDRQQQSRGDEGELK